MSKIITCHDYLNNEYKVKADELKFRPSVYGILIEDGKILLSPQYDGYDFPGGGQEIWESVDDVLEREFFEETGLKVKRGPVVACETSFFNPSSKDEHWNCLMIYFLCTKMGGELSDKYFDEHEKEYARLAEWIDLNNISKLKYFNPVDSVAIIERAVKMMENGD